MRIGFPSTAHAQSGKLVLVDRLVPSTHPLIETSLSSRASSAYFSREKPVPKNKFTWERVDSRN